MLMWSKPLDEQAYDPAVDGGVLKVNVSDDSGTIDGLT
jgi:hypothetical protein